MTPGTGVYGGCNADCTADHEPAPEQQRASCEAPEDRFELGFGGESLLFADFDTGMDGFQVCGGCGG